MSEAIYVHKPEDIPHGEHWAIIEGTSVHIPADARSLAHPGHGYPESTEHFITYTAYLNKEIFERALLRTMEENSLEPITVRGIHVEATFKRRISLDIAETK